MTAAEILVQDASKSVSLREDIRLINQDASRFAAPSEYASTNYPVPYDSRMKGINEPYPEHAVDGGAFLVMGREELGSVDPLEDYVESMEVAKLKNPDVYGP